MSITNDSDEGETIRQHEEHVRYRIRARAFDDGEWAIAYALLEVAGAIRFLTNCVCGNDAYGRGVGLTEIAEAINRMNGGKNE